MTELDDRDNAPAEGVRSAIRLFADNMLGSLVRLLRLCGFDVRYARGDLEDAELVAVAAREDRVVLTADRALVERRSCSRYVLLESHDPWEQLETLLRELDLDVDPSRLFSRCLSCNDVLEEVGRERVRGLVPRYVLATRQRFGRCPGCHRVYWRGSHVEDLERRLMERVPHAFSGDATGIRGAGRPARDGSGGAGRTPASSPAAAVVLSLVLAATTLASPVACAGAGEAGPAAETADRSQEEARIAADRDRLIEELRRQGIDDETVLEAIASVARHRFVPEAYRAHAWENTALPIGHGQTISQPFVVALMTELLELGEGDRVLEVGTGSGYQAAVLAELGCRVYTVEIVPELAETARARLQELGYDGVHVRTGDGYHGWEEEAPFDGVIVTAAPEEVPEPLIEQLRVGGRMVIPVGPQHRGQVLTMLTKEEDGELRRRRVLPVRFVPFVRDPGSSRPDGRRD